MSLEHVKTCLSPEGNNLWLKNKSKCKQSGIFTILTSIQNVNSICTNCKNANKAKKMTYLHSQWVTFLKIVNKAPTI
jgi:hypothetical protein